MVHHHRLQKVDALHLPPQGLHGCYVYFSCVHERVLRVIMHTTTTRQQDRMHGAPEWNSPSPRSSSRREALKPMAQLLARPLLSVQKLSCRSARFSDGLALMWWSYHEKETNAR